MCVIITCKRLLALFYLVLILLLNISISFRSCVFMQPIGKSLVSNTHNRKINALSLKSVGREVSVPELTCQLFETGTPMCLCSGCRYSTVTSLNGAARW